MPHCPNPRCQAEYPPGTKICANPYCRCLLPEAVVAGRYRIETLIGMGGMGAVYRASDTFEMKQVALKVLSISYQNMDPQTAIERFRREARYAHQLRHRNIVPVVNFGQDGELLYLEMPLITGGTLKALLKPEKPLPTQQALTYLKDMAAAIDAVHQHPQQIVHRDIKPSNLLIHQDDGRLILADFGIARAMQQEKSLTQRGLSIGTEHYIAPEQEQGKPEPASDIYAMGVVTYQMFTGLLPMQAVIKTLAAEIPPPSALNHALPPNVDPVIMRAMDIDPKKRFTSAGEFAQAVEDALHSDPIHSAPTIVAPTIMATSNANVIVRTVMPENPCPHCGRENRSSSRFCRHCGRNLDATAPAVADHCQLGYISELGRKAQENEDMLLVIQGLCTNLEPPPSPFSLLAISDGLLGTQGQPLGGHEASRLAIESVADIMVPRLTEPPRSLTHYTPPMGSNSSTGPRGPIPGSNPGVRPSETVLQQWISDAARQANQVVYHCNADYDSNMACTLTVALLYHYQLHVASIGDSRAYVYNADADSLYCITRDHTIAATLVASKLLEPDDVYKSAKRNHHYRTLGQNYYVPIDYFQQSVAPNDIILLCTDGLWHMLRDSEIQRLLAQGGTPEEMARRLTDAANDAGGEGNISAIVAIVS